MAEQSEVLQRAQDTIKEVGDGELPQVTGYLGVLNTKVAEAETTLKKIREANLVLRPRPVFKYLAGKSVPSLNITFVTPYCPCCPGLGFVASASINASCGCMFHLHCMAGLFQKLELTCPRCKVDFDGAWVAQFGGPLTEEMERSVSSTNLELSKLEMGATEPSLKQGKFVTSNFLITNFLIFKSLHRLTYCHSTFSK